VRSDSLATTIVIAAASSASPASWPPMSRESSGSAEEVWVIRASLGACVGLADGVACGVTVGNRPDRASGVMVAPGIGTSVVGGSGAWLDGGWMPCPTTAATAASAGEKPLADTVTARAIGRPVLAVDLTWSVTISSNA